MPSLSAPLPRDEAMTASQPYGHCFENRSLPSRHHHHQYHHYHCNQQEQELERGGEEEDGEEDVQGDQSEQEQSTRTSAKKGRDHVTTTTFMSQPQQNLCHRHSSNGQPWLCTMGRLVILLAWISFALLFVVDAGRDDGIFEDMPLLDISSINSTASNATSPSQQHHPVVGLHHLNHDEYDAMYDPPYRIPGLTQDEFDETWYGEHDTIKIGVLLPFSPNPQYPYMTPLSRISLSVLRMAIRDMNDRKVIPGMNMSLVVRDSQQHIPGTNVSGGAAAISATTRVIGVGVGGVIGDIASDLTTAEAIMTSSVGIPQCSFASYNMDTTLLSSFVYLFRSVPGVSKYIEALALVVKHYNWTKVSIIHTSDIPGILGEKAFSAVCAANGIEVTRFAIPLPQGRDIMDVARSVIRSVKNSDTRIHVLAAPRAVQIPLLEAIRDIGLFHPDHVWLTTIDLTDSISRLPDSADFNGLIMADALWDMPGVPEYDRFVTNWLSLNPDEYPMSGSPMLTWHETFAYTCIQVFAEAYKGLVENAMALTNVTVRDRLLGEILRGKRSQDLTLKYLGSRTYSTPIGNFTVSKGGEAIKTAISISSFQNSDSIPHGRAINDQLSIFNHIIFKDGSTTPPSDAPRWEDVNPSISSPFGIIIVVLTSLLMFAIVCTAIIVVIYRENIVIKSASPLFCILELFGLATTLSWIYLRIDLPSPTTCRMGLLLVVVGLSINLSALVVKNYRIYRIFNSVSVINHAVSNRYLLRVVTIPVVLTIIPCLVRCFYKYFKPTLIRTNDHEYWVTCSTSETSTFWDIIVGAMPIFINLFGIYLAFKTRNVTRLWNEARSIAITIYLVSFFVIIIIIVQSFPLSLYSVTFHVTISSVFLASLIEYIILFYPKLRDLFLQRRGLHVAAGRDGDGVDSILGGVSATLGGGGGGGGGGVNRGRLSAAALLADEGNRFGGSSRYFGSTGELLAGSAQGSISSTEMQQRQQQQLQHKQLEPNISDLVSSYPFGQLNADGGAPPMVSPVHRPNMYEPSSSLINRGGKKGGAAGGSDQEGGPINALKLPDAHRATGRSTGVASGAGEGTTTSKPAAVPTVGTGGVIPPAKGYDTFVRDRSVDIRNSRDAQPVDLHDVLLPSSNYRSNAGILSVSGGAGRSGSQDLSMYDFLGGGGGAGGAGGNGNGSDKDPYSRNSSVVEYDALGMIHRLRTGGGGNRSPKMYPLQTNYTGSNGVVHSSRHSLKERRTDSYTVTAPVQRQRWYVVQFLAQWRMSKIIFVPYSKLLVIVDLETERSESLIVHTIEQGYSASDYWTKTEQAQHINTSIYPGDNSSNSLMMPPLSNTNTSSHGFLQTLQLPPIKAQHLQEQQQGEQGQQGLQGQGRATSSPLAHPTVLAPNATGGDGQGQGNIKPVLASNQLHPNIQTSPQPLNPDNNISNNNNNNPLQENKETRPPLRGLDMSYQMSEETILAPLDDGGPLSPVTTARRGNLPAGASVGLGSTADGVIAPESGSEFGPGVGRHTTSITMAPGAAGSGTGVTIGVAGAAGRDVEEVGSGGSLRRRFGSISGFNNGIRRMSTFLGFSGPRNPTGNLTDAPLTTSDISGMEGEGDSDGLDDQKQQQGAANGIEQGIISEHIIRVISIHNEVWRVQLPDPDTMERWIEIGQQIKDENWISRPLTMRESSGDTGAKKSGSGGTGGTGMTLRMGMKRGSSGSGGGGSRAAGMSMMNETSPEGKYDFALRPPLRRPGVAQMQQRSSFHPLQPLPFSISTSFGSTGNHNNGNLLHPVSSSSADNSPQRRIDPMRFDSDVTQETSISTSSQDTDRKQIRERAARINQEMRATTTKYVPPLFRGLRKQQQQHQQTPSIMDSPRLGGERSSPFGSPRPSSSGTRFRSIPSSLSMAPITAAAAQRFGSNSNNNSNNNSRNSSYRSEPPQQRQDGPLSAPAVTPSRRHRLSESFLPLPVSPSTPTFPTTTLPDLGGNTSSEETSIRDVLAETNVFYDQGQHAVYEDPLPGHEHRGYRHFNTIQYNYDQQPYNNNHHPSRSSSTHRRRRRRRSGMSENGIDGYDNDDDYELDLELDMDFATDSEWMAMHGGGGSGSGKGIGMSRGSKPPGASPESPQWHLTSVELAKMESENLQRSIAAAAVATSASGGSGARFGTTSSIELGAAGLDDIRSTGSGGSGNSAATATVHTNSAPTSASPNTSAPLLSTPKSLPAGTTSSGLSSRTSSYPGSDGGGGGGRGGGGGLPKPPLGGTRFSRFSPGVPAVSFSDAPDQEFPWQQPASSPHPNDDAYSNSSRSGRSNGNGNSNSNGQGDNNNSQSSANPIIIYSPPPPEPGEMDYQDLTSAVAAATVVTAGGAVVVVGGGGGNGTTTSPPPLERFQSLSPAIMHLPPPAIGSFHTTDSDETIVEFLSGALASAPLPPATTAAGRPHHLSVQSPRGSFSPRSSSQRAEYNNNNNNNSFVRVPL